MKCTLEPMPGMRLTAVRWQLAATLQRWCQTGNWGQYTAAISLGIGIFALIPVGAAAQANSHRHRHPVLKNQAVKDEYYYVTRNPGESKRSYPAPAGAEDIELLPETWYYLTGWNMVTHQFFNGAIGYPELNWVYSPGGTWWFSQVVGDDYTSHYSHYADMKNTANDPSLVPNYFEHPPEFDQETNIGVNRLYGAAFDIVLRDVSVTRNLGGPLPDFAPYVVNLRNSGIVCWHRWVGEDIYRPSETLENEMHCIDPAAPYIKSGLQTQITGPYGFMSKLNGSRSYTSDLLPGQSTAANWSSWFLNVRWRQKGAFRGKLQWMLDIHPWIRACADAKGVSAIPLPEIPPQ